MKTASLLLLALSLRAETGRDAWLRYAPVPSLQAPAVVSAVGDSVLVASARQEVILGLRGMTGKISRSESGVPKESAIVLGTLASLPSPWALTASLQEDGYWLKTINKDAIQYTVVTAINERGVLYGAFALLRKMALGESIEALDER